MSNHQHSIHTALRPPQPLLRPPTRHSQSMRHPLRALTRRRRPGRAPQIAHRGLRTLTSQAALPHNNPKKLLLRRIIHTLHSGPSRILGSLHTNLDSTLGAPNVSAHIGPKMDRPQLHALGHHHHWCDKVNEKITSSIVLLVS
jgi:hypothetical protein